MKLILGDPGKPDGWIPPDSYENEFKDDHDCSQSANGEKCRKRKTFKINGLDVNLFNITGDIRIKCCFMLFTNEYNLTKISSYYRFS